MGAPSELTSLSTSPARHFCPLTSARHRRQIHALLFRELALAVRRNLALDQALASIAATRTLRSGAAVVYTVLFFLTAIGLILLACVQSWAVFVFVGLFAWGPLLIGAARPHEDYLRYVANRLATAVWQGYELDVAMKRMPDLFGPEERRIVMVGGRTGRLAEAFDALVSFNRLTARFNRLAAAITYPVTVLFLCGFLVLFMYFRIVPRYMDMFSQLGLEIPAFTMNVLVQGSWYSPVGSWMGIPLVLLALIALGIGPFFLAPRLVGGSLKLTALFVLTVAAAVGSIAAPYFAEIADDRYGIQAVTIAVFGATIGGSVVLAIFLYFLIRWVNGFVSFVARPVAEFFVGRFGVLRKVRLARFLLTLGHTLEARIPLPEALDMAGRVAGGRLREEAIVMKALVEQGQSLNERIRTSPFFRGRIGAILALAEWRGSLGRDCLDLAEHLRTDIERSLARTAALIEWPMIIAVGVLLGVFAVACYWPLFYVPHALGAMQ